MAISTSVLKPVEDPWLSRPPAINFPDQFWEGLTAAWHGWRFLRRQPRLWWYAIVPTLLCALISLVITVAVVTGAIWLTTALHDSFAGQFTGWGWYAALVGEILLILAIAPILLLLTIVLWKILTTLLCGFFFSRLALEVERLLGIDPRELNPVSTMGEAAGLIYSLAVLVLGSVALIALIFIPVIGGGLSFVFGTLFTCWIMGLDYFGYPLALRGVPRWRQYPFGWKNKSRTVGLGLFVSTCELVPILGAMPLTAAVIGAVLLHRKCTK